MYGLGHEIDGLREDIKKRDERIKALQRGQLQFAKDLKLALKKIERLQGEIKKWRDMYNRLLDLHSSGNG